MDDVYDYLDRVTDKESFLKFMKALIDDYRNNPDEWEHDTIDYYLDAIMAWIIDFSSCERNNIDWDKIDYSTIAELFFAGKIYE